MLTKGRYANFFWIFSKPGEGRPLYPTNSMSPVPPTLIALKDTMSFGISLLYGLEGKGLSIGAQGHCVPLFLAAPMSSNQITQPHASAGLQRVRSPCSHLFGRVDAVAGPTDRRPQALRTSTGLGSSPASRCPRASFMRLRPEASRSASSEASALATTLINMA